MSSHGHRLPGPAEADLAGGRSSRQLKEHSMTMSPSLSRRKLIAGLILAAEVSCVRSGRRVRVSSDSVQEAAETWLERNCTVGEQDHLEEVLKRNSAQAEKFFLNALNIGPPPEKVRDVERASALQYA